MKDQLGRTIDYMRISITDRCNLRCRYCMPQDTEKLPAGQILSCEEIWEIVRQGVQLGITHYRITGGEPLVRRDCVRLIRGICRIPGVASVTMTTNGVALEALAGELKEAGLDGINVSLDTLEAEEFYHLTGRDALALVLRGIEAAVEAGLPVKLNTVSRSGLDPFPLLAFAEAHGTPVRFIEMMPIGCGKESPGMANDELRQSIEQRFGPASLSKERMGNGPARYVSFPGLTCQVGFISAVHHRFCGECNRVRLTAEGYLKLCLCYDSGTDLRGILRREKSAEELRNRMEEAISKKPKEHCFEHPEEITEERIMAGIGG